MLISSKILIKNEMKWFTMDVQFNTGITVCIDCREPNTSVELFKAEGIKTFYTLLAIADYIIYYRSSESANAKPIAFVERKTWKDAWDSLVDSRWDNERWNMHVANITTFWIIEGNKTQLVEQIGLEGIERLDQKMDSTIIYFRQPIMYSRDYFETIKKVARIAKKALMIPSPPPLQNRFKLTEQAPVAMLCGAENVGEVLAKLALDRYPSVIENCRAIDKLGFHAYDSIKGMGAKKASYIIDGLCKTYTRNP